MKPYSRSRVNLDFRALQVRGEFFKWSESHFAVSVGHESEIALSKTFFGLLAELSDAISIVHICRRINLQEQNEEM